MLPTAEVSVVESMDGDNPAIYPFLPYIMQDLWELGTFPHVIAELIDKHITDPQRLSVIDLGCGKGAVCIQLAARYGCRCLGLDAVAAFIEAAEKKAAEHLVAHLCRFQCEDIRDCIGTMSGYDLIVLGAIGPVLGDYNDTLRALSPCLRPGGHIMIDDAYSANAQSAGVIDKSGAPCKQDIINSIHAAGMRLVDETVIDAGTMAEHEAIMYRYIEKRCEQLCDMHPDQTELFRDYLEHQRVESLHLQTETVCATFMILKPD